MLKKDFKVSIITVSYNEVKTIEQTMLSVFNQSYGNIEYIVIDGNSTDGTQAVIEKYKEKLAYYISEPDDGIYDAMNKGIQKASGDIVGMINSNDWYEPDAVERAVICFANTNAQVVHSEIRHIYENGEEACSERKPLSELWYHNVVQHPSVFCYRELYRQYGLFNLKYHILADYDLMLRWYEQGVKFVYLDGIAANFRMGGVSNSSIKASEECRLVSISHLDKCFDYDRAVLSELIERRYGYDVLKYMLKSNPEILEDYLQKQCTYIEDGIYIFGSGKMGEEYSCLLKKMGIPILAFLDNNSNKWGTSLNGIPVKNPNILRSGKKCVLVLVKDYARDICRQLEGLKNNELMWLGWEKIKDGLFEQMELE